MHQKEVVKKIKMAMLDSDFNQADLGKKLGVKQSMVSHWFTGYRNPSFISLKKVAKATNKPLSYFLDDSENISGNNYNNINGNSSVGAIVGHKNNGNTVHVNSDLENHREQLVEKVEKNSEKLEKDLEILKKDSEKNAKRLEKNMEKLEKIVEKNSEMLNLKLELILEKLKK